MYYLSKFCRICVQTGVKLLDLDTIDFDEVRLSKKLEVCTKMVVASESLSSEICVQCIAKLRISYQFHDMCKKSTQTLQGYLEALLSTNDEKSLKDFVKTELNVIVAPLENITNNDYINYIAIDSDNTQIHKEKRKRITKEQRCSLLKQLLTPSQKYNRDRDKFYEHRNFKNNSYKGGLKNIIRFTRNYEFGLTVDKNSNYDLTPLDKLTAFSKDFFRKDFSEFKNTILYIIENKDNLCESGESEDEYSFNEPEEEDEDTQKKIVKFEEVIVEPDIKIKAELDFEDEGECTSNYEYCDPFTESLFKKEEMEANGNIHGSTVHQCSTMTIPTPNQFSEYVRNFRPLYPSSSSMLLDSLVGNYSMGQRRTFSQTNVRCRTRDNPYINPMLKDQFLYRCFKCDKCNRYFKSPGYLKAHYSKLH